MVFGYFGLYLAELLCVPDDALRIAVMPGNARKINGLAGNGNFIKFVKIL